MYTLPGKPQPSTLNPQPATLNRQPSTGQDGTFPNNPSASRTFTGFITRVSPDGERKVYCVRGLTEKQVEDFHERRKTIDIEALVSKGSEIDDPDRKTRVFDLIASIRDVRTAFYNGKSDMSLKMKLNGGGVLYEIPVANGCNEPKTLDFNDSRVWQFRENRDLNTRINNLNRSLQALDDQGREPMKPFLSPSIGTQQTFPNQKPTVRNSNVTLPKMAEPNSPLVDAARRGALDEVARLLNEPHVDVNQMDQDGNTALMLASVNSDLDMANLLLGYGAAIHMRNNEGQTALTLANECGGKIQERIQFHAKQRTILAYKAAYELQKQQQKQLQEQQKQQKQQKQLQGGVPAAETVRYDKSVKPKHFDKEESVKLCNADSVYMSLKLHADGKKVAVINAMNATNVGGGFFKIIGFDPKNPPFKEVRHSQEENALRIFDASAIFSLTRLADQDQNKTWKYRDPMNNGWYNGTKHPILYVSNNIQPLISPTVVEKFEPLRGRYQHFSKFLDDQFAIDGVGILNQRPLSSSAKGQGNIRMISMAMPNRQNVSNFPSHDRSYDDIEKLAYEQFRAVLKESEGCELVLAGAGLGVFAYYPWRHIHDEQWRKAIVRGMVRAIKLFGGYPSAIHIADHEEPVNDYFKKYLSESEIKMKGSFNRQFTDL